MAHSHRKSRFSTALDWGVAGLACTSAGFVLAAMPDDLFSGLVVRSGLPNLVEAAQPPLGGTARLAAVAAAALFAFAFVLSLLRALERRPAPASAKGGEDGPKAAPEALRLRKADSHPDAPPRRPILAGRELGEPLETIDPLDGSDDELLLEPEVAHEEFEPEPEPQPQPQPATAAVPAFLVPQDEPWDEPVEALRDADPEFEEEPEAEAEPARMVEWAAPGEPESVFEAQQETGFEAEPEPDYPEVADLSALMERFESGLTRKQQAIVRPAPQPDPVPPIIEAVPVVEEPADRVGHRLRSAIAELQKVAGEAR